MTGPYYIKGPSVNKDFSEVLAQACDCSLRDCKLICTWLDSRYIRDQEREVGRLYIKYTSSSYQIGAL